MANELHIQLHADVIEPSEELLQDFPFEPGQSFMRLSNELVIIDLAEAEDTSYVQEWYLNTHDAVFSFYVVEG